MKTLGEFSIAVQHAVLDPETASSASLPRHDLYHGLSAALLTQLLQETQVDVSVEKIPWNGALLESLTALTERFMERDANTIKNLDTDSFSNPYSSPKHKAGDFVEEFYAEYENAIKKSIEYYLEEIFKSAAENNPNFIIKEERQFNNQIKYFGNPFFDDNHLKIGDISRLASSLFLNDERSCVPKGFVYFWISRVATMELALTDCLKVSHPWRELEHAQKENIPLEVILTSATKTAKDLSQETTQRSPNITEIANKNHAPIGLATTVRTLATYTLDLNEFLDRMKWALVPAGMQQYAREIMARPAADVLSEAEQKKQVLREGIENMLTRIF